MDGLRKRFLRPTDRGFSLVELLVVIAILGILMAIAIPSFIGAKRNGQDSQPQASLRAALSAERTTYIDYQTYTTDQTKLRGIEPNVVWTTTDAKVGGVMVATNLDRSGVVLVSTSASGNQFCIMSLATDVSLNGQTTAGTYYGTNAATVSPPSTSVTTGQCGSTYSRDAGAGWSTN